MKNRLALTTLALMPVLGITSYASGQIGTVNYEYVNVRTSTNASSSVAFVLKKGEKVTVISEKNNFLNIEKNNKKGWVQKSAIKIESSEAKNINNFIKKSPAESFKYIGNDVLNFRTSPSTNSDIIRVLNRNDKVQVISESAGWTKVRFEGQEGYLSSRFLVDSINNNSEKVKNVVNTTNDTNTKVMYVTSNVLNARATSSAVSEKVFSLVKGDVVVVENINNGWAKVNSNGKVGYVSSYYLKDTLDNNYKKTSNIKTDSLPSESVNTSEAPVGVLGYIDMNMSLYNHADIQMSKALNVVTGAGYHKASRDEIVQAMNPANLMSPNSKYQFARLDKYTEIISVDQLNSYLNRYCKQGSVFYNQGAAFINAARNNNINVLYLVAHSMIETGNGTSQLAKGVACNGKIVYNFFGIGAVDGNALANGANTAYKNGWTSVAAGIDGAAQWISTKYIHSSKYNQNTLYKMKWSPEFVWHQYATDINWPTSISTKMSEIAANCNSLTSLSFDIPQYK